MKEVYDVCVVGSGPGGGIAAYALATAGAKVALVEAGPKLRPGVDFNAHGSPFAKLETRLKAGRTALVSSVWQDYAERNHFTSVGDSSGHGLLKAVGGRSLCWAGHCLRFGRGDFRQWPIAYDEVATYYSRAEKFMAVYGHRDGLWNMPDGEFLKPVALRCGERALESGVGRLKSQSRQIEFIGLRKAMPTEPHPIRKTQCHYCGHCMRGCEVDAKYTSANTPIPLAQATGNLTLFTESTMVHIVMDRDPRRVAGILYRTADGKIERIDCKALVLACSALETSRQLLANNTKELPSGLANSSGQVGRNISSHFGVTVVGVFPQLKQRDPSNDDGTDYYHGLVTGLYWDKPNPSFEGSYQIQCGSGIHPIEMAVRNVPGFGSEFKRRYFEINNIHAGLGMQGAIAMSAANLVDLDPERRDAYGVPLPRLNLHYGENDLAMARDMVQLSEEIIEAGGGTVHSKPKEITSATLRLDQNHWVGGARMGRDPKTSVVNLDSQTHDIANLFIGDASVFPAYPEKNPTLTNIALSWRMSDRLAAKFRRGEL
ncbi:MAG TPA: GMC family oxidoreductase [Bryobacteraceae bacterium]|jgi:choline dehydrogenase-like flavoprotein|nr:GMC family oxidoreductase [Bryobacteraceae bacterium]